MKPGPINPMRVAAIPLLILCFSLAAPSVQACGFHFSFSPMQGRFAGSAFPPSFTLRHSSVLKTQPGVEVELSVSYEVLDQVTDASMEVQAVGEVEVLSPASLELDAAGDILVKLLPGPSVGYQTVTLTISGQRDGKTVRLDRSVFLVNEKVAPRDMASDLTLIETR